MLRQVVLYLKGDGAALAEARERLYLRVGRPADDGARLERSDAAVVAGLAEGHPQVVVGREVEDVVPHPAHVQGLTLHGALAHLADDLQHRQLGGVVEPWSRTTMVQTRPKA